MLRVWAVLLLLSVLVQSFSKQVVFTEFLVNRSFIAQVLCEKKADPGNHCQGKCQLKKQLNQDTERQEKSKQQVKNSIDILFSMDYETIRFGTYPAKETLNNTGIISTILKGHFLSVFHPPSC